MDSGTGILEPGTLWDLPCCTCSMRWSKKSGSLWYVPQCTLWYMKGIPKSHGTAVGNAGQPSFYVCRTGSSDSYRDVHCVRVATCAKHAQSRRGAGGHWPPCPPSGSAPGLSFTLKS